MEQGAQLAERNVQPLEEIRAHWLSRLAHDFRGPLFAARGYSKLVLNDANQKLAPSHRDYLEKVCENLDRIAALVGGIQQFPVSHALNLETIDVAQILHTAAARAKQQLPATHIHVELQGHAFTFADRAKLATATQGLLALAVEFAGSEGELRLHARSDEGEITARFSAWARNSSAASVAEGDIYCEIVRLHGGSAHIDKSREGTLHVTIRLPLVGTSLVSSVRQEGHQHA